MKMKLKYYTKCTDVVCYREKKREIIGLEKIREKGDNK